MIVLRLAWKNIWRNKIRSSIYILATVIGMSLTLFTLSIVEGIIESRIKDLINLETSHLQIHQVDFLEERKLNDFIQNTSELVGFIEALPQVKAVASRQLIDAVIQSPYNNQGIRLVGVNPDREKKISTLNDFFVEGDFLKGKNKILVSEKTAKKLNLKIRSKAVVSFQDLEKNLVGGAFRVSGIFKTPNSVYDEGHAFVAMDSVTNIAQLGQAHEIAVLLYEEVDKDSFKNELTKVVGEKSSATPNQNSWVSLKVETWEELKPEIAIYSEIVKVNNFIIFSLILIGLGFILINIINMIIQERLIEIGVLRSLGFKRREIFLMLVFEGNFMTLTGSLIGISIGAVVILIFSQNEISLFQGFESFGFRNAVTPKFNGINVVIGIALSFFMSFVIGIIPAFRMLLLKLEKLNQ